MTGGPGGGHTTSNLQDGRPSKQGNIALSGRKVPSAGSSSMQPPPEDAKAGRRRAPKFSEMMKSSKGAAFDSMDDLEGVPGAGGSQEAPNQDEEINEDEACCDSCSTFWRRTGFVMYAWAITMCCHHTYCGMCTRFDYTSPRYTRLGVFIAAVLTAMFVTTFFWGFRGCNDPEDPSCEDPFTFWETVVFGLIAAVLELPVVYFFEWIFERASEECFRLHFFALWRELEIRRAAEARFGQILQHLRARLVIASAESAMHHPRTLEELEEDFFAACSRHFLQRYLVDPKEKHRF